MQKGSKNYGLCYFVTAYEITIQYIERWYCYPVGTGSNWTSSECLVYVQFTSCVYGVCSINGSFKLTTGVLISIWLLPVYRRRSLEVFFQTGVLKMYAKFTGKHLCWSLSFSKFASLQLYQIETPTQVFFCEFWKTFKNTHFIEHLGATVSEDKKVLFFH